MIYPYLEWPQARKIKARFEGVIGVWERMIDGNYFLVGGSRVARIDSGKEMGVLSVYIP